jgi:hypothetical protein
LAGKRHWVTKFQKTQDGKNFGFEAPQTEMSNLKTLKEKIQDSIRYREKGKSASLRPLGYLTLITTKKR